MRHILFVDATKESKMEQLSMFGGARSGMEKVRPYAEGDIVVKPDHSRWVVTVTEKDAQERDVLCVVCLADGREGVILPHKGEVLYRTNKAH